MNIKLAENSGFCFGVSRALKMVEDLLKNDVKVCTFGELIHNNKVIEDLQNRGVKVVHSISDIENSLVVIRSHGTTKDVLNALKRKQVKYIDATCPFVKRIHNIVKNNSLSKDILLVAGKSTHPEVEGICSYFSGKVYTFENLVKLKEIILSQQKMFNTYSGLMVAQTTFSVEKWQECVNFISKGFTNIRIYDTICNITSLRQLHAEKLAKSSDLIIVVGGYNSSNTVKLYEICKDYVKTIHIEKCEELKNYDLKKFNNIGITAGASTPMYEVERVINYLNCIVRNHI